LEGADRFAFSAALGATLVRVGNFLNSEIVGRETHADWGVRFVKFDGANAPLRHPSQLYEVALGLFVLLCLYLVDRAFGKEKRPRALLISVFFVVYFAGRFTVEFFKEHQTLPADHPLTMGQYLSIPAFLLGLYGLQWSLKTRQPVGWPRDDEDDFEDDEDGLDDDDDDLDEDDDLDDDADEDERPVRQRSRRKKPKLFDPDVDAEFEARPGKSAAPDADADAALDPDNSKTKGTATGQNSPQRPRKTKTRTKTKTKKKKLKTSRN
jgi:hypothetical protein